jgi:hypothetical protein
MRGPARCWRAPAAEVSTIAPGAVGDLPNEGGHEHDEQ